MTWSVGQKEEAVTSGTITKLAWLTIFLCSCSAPMSSLDGNPHQSLEAAWSSWIHGDIEAARITAEAAPDSDERRHMLCLCVAVFGQHTEVLSHYAMISSAYVRMADLDDTIIQAYRQLGKPAEAVAFARRRGLSAAVERLTPLAEHPFQVHLDGVTIIPFEENALSEHMPSIRAQIGEHDLTAYLDTGAPYLVMGPDAAHRLSIALTKAGRGFHGTNRVELHDGRAPTLTFGKVRCDNVPVTVMPDLGDMVIIGTAVLSQFLVTVDYPRHQMILSSRLALQSREHHLGMLLPRRVVMPFFCWGDHYLFAKGGIGLHQDLTFFIDSGLVAIDPQGRQACFTTTRDRLHDWGFPTGESTFVTSEVPLVLGSGQVALQMDSPLVYVSKAPPWTSFGGVRIDGLLSHGFLKHYQWTMDFDRHQFLFGQP